MSRFGKGDLVVAYAWSHAKLEHGDFCQQPDEESGWAKMRLWAGNPVEVIRKGFKGKIPTLFVSPREGVECVVLAENCTYPGEGDLSIDRPSPGMPQPGDICVLNGAAVYQYFMAQVAVEKSKKKGQSRRIEQLESQATSTELESQATSTEWYKEWRLIKINQGKATIQSGKTTTTLPAQFLHVLRRP